MRRYREMLELIKHQGIVTYTKYADNAHRGPATDADWTLAESARVFVYSGEPFTESISADALMSQAHLAGPLAMPDVDAPFPVFTIELAGDKPLAISTVDKLVRRPNSPPVPVPGEHIYVETWCLLVQEIKPKVYGFWSYHRQRDPKAGYSFHQIAKTNNDGEIVTHYLNRLAKERAGLEHVRERIKIGSGKLKRVHQLTEVIHVRPKSDAVGGNGTREIDWTHRFEVRGHWRECRGIGKDRAGDYCVSGHTWVTEHVRGPENLPLIKKTRLVETPKEPEKPDDEPKD